MIKKLALIFLLLIPTIALAQSTSNQFYVIEDFSKGLQSHTSEYANPEGSASEAQNVRINTTYGALAKRQAQIAYATCSAAPVESIHRYYKSDSTKYTIVTSDSYIYYSNDLGVCQQIGQGFTTGAKWNWETYKNIAIGTNGYDRPVKYDGLTQVTANTSGSRTAGDLVAQLGAPFAKLYTGAHLTANKWYQYHIAYFDSTNYQFSAAKSNPILTGSTVNDVTLTDIPLGPSGTTQRLIYRTLGKDTRTAVLAETNYYLVATISDNATQTYNDVATDATIGADAVPKWSTVSSGINATPPYGRFSQIHKERLWLADDLSGVQYGSSSIYFSEAYKPDYFLSQQNYFLARPDDGDAISFLKPFQGVLYVGKTNSINRLNTDGFDPNITVGGVSTVRWYITPGVSFIGCVAPYSAVTTPAGIIYLGAYGLYIFGGQSSSLISDPVTKDIRDINQTNWGNVAGVFFNNEYDMAYTSQVSAENINNRVLIYDTIRSAYVKDTKYVDSWGIFDSGTDFGTLFSGSSKSDGKVVANTISPDQTIIRYKGELDGGTFTNTASSGTEEYPTLNLGWGNLTIDSAVYSGVTIDGYVPHTAIIDRPVTNGTWISTGILVNASKYSKLYWNSDNGSTGSVTVAMRSASTLAGLTGASWTSEYSNPSGSDVSAASANVYVQFRVTLNTSDINYSPELYSQDGYALRLAYSKIGSLSETSVLSIWQSGWSELKGTANYPKVVREADIYYEGTAGTLTVNIQNLKGDIAASFTIDLSQARDPAKGYFGYDGDKVFRYIFPTVPGSANFLVGDKFMITISESGSSEWKIKRLSLRYDTSDYVPYR